MLDLTALKETKGTKGFKDGKATKEAKANKATKDSKARTPEPKALKANRGLKVIRASKA